MIRYLYSIFLFCTVFLATGTVHAQVEDLPKNAKIDLVPEEENLNVFQQWLRWI